MIVEQSRKEVDRIQVRVLSMVAVPDATIRMTDVLHMMVVHTYVLRVELG